MSLNKWLGYGRLCADPEFRQTQSGVAVCRFRIAVNRNYSKDGEQKADFISCTAWRQTAEFISRYFTKGSAIIVEGQLHNSDYTDNNGVKHYGMEIAVDNVSFGESKREAAQNAPESTQRAAPQFDSVTSPRAQAAHTAQSEANRGIPLNLGEFEEILSDGDLPF